MYCNIKVSFLECHPPHIDEYWMYSFLGPKKGEFNAEPVYLKLNK